MEVLAFIVSDKSFLGLLKDFLLNNKDLYLEGEDVDTLFFNKQGSSRHEIYFHDYWDNVEEEFSINYTQDEKETIQKFFGNGEIFMFGVQFRDNDFMDKLLNSFKHYLEEAGNNWKKKILLFHPFHGIIAL